MSAYINRRSLLGFTAAATLAAALRAFAQQAQPARAPGGRPWLIAALINISKAQSDIDTLPPFKSGLASLGYVEGRDYRVEARYADGDPTLIPPAAIDLVKLGPDMVLASSGPAALALRTLTETIPIVAYIADETTIDLLVGNRGKPLGNVTGITTDSASLTGKHCDLALEIVPRAKRIGALASTANSVAGKGTRDAVNAAAAARGFERVIVDVAPTDVAAGFKSLAAQNVDAVIVGSGFNNDRAFVARSAAAVGLPTVYNEQGYVEAGGLVSYGFSRVKTFAQLASFCDLLFKGSRVGDVPFQETTSYYLAVNLGTAKSLGLTMPQSVLFRADEVIQ